MSGDNGRPVMTYCFLDDWRHLLKIGRTAHLQTRQANLEAAIGHRLVLLGAVEGDRELEWHHLLHPHRQKGEWFTLNRSTAEWVRITFNARVRAPGERKIAPAKSDGVDLREDLESRAGTALLTAGDLDELELDLYAEVCQPALDDIRRSVLEEEVEDGSTEGRATEDELIRWADEDVEEVHRFVERWKELIVGWLKPRDELWIALWLPRSPTRRQRMITDAFIAEDDGFWHGHLNFLFVDRASMAVTELKDHADKSAPLSEEELRQIRERMNAVAWPGMTLAEGTGR